MRILHVTDTYGPTIGGIDCLFERPHEVVDQWRFRTDEFARTMDDTRTRILADLDKRLDEIVDRTPPKGGTPRPGPRGRWR